MRILDWISLGPDVEEEWTNLELAHIFEDFVSVLGNHTTIPSFVFNLLLRPCALNQGLSRCDLSLNRLVNTRVQSCGRSTSQVVTDGLE